MKTLNNTKWKSFRQPLLLNAFIASAITLAISVIVPSARAQSADTWVGSTDGNFSTVANWTYSVGSGPATNGDSLIFNDVGTAGLLLTNNLTVDSTFTSLTFNGPAAFSLSGNEFILGGTFKNLGSSLQTINTPIVMTAVRTFTTTGGGGDLILAGNMSGAGGGITTAGSGTLLVNGTNSFTGVTTVGAGTLKIGNLSALGVGLGAQVAVAGILDFNGFSITNPIVNKGLSGTLRNNGAAVDLTAMGVATLGSASRTFIVDGTGDMTFGQAITHSGSGGYTVVKNGSNKVIFSGTPANSLAGLIVNSGTLVLAKTNANSANVSFSINGGTVQLSGAGGDQIANGATVTVTNGGTLDMNGMNETITTLKLSDAGVSGAGALVNNGSTNSTLTGAVTLTGDATIGGSTNLTLASAVSGTGFGLTKIGNGTLTLNVASTYSGGTTVKAGKLTLATNVTLVNSSSISVSNGAIFDVSASGFTLGGSQTLLGSGLVHGAATNSAGSIVYPGGNGTVGTLTSDSMLNMNAGGVIYFDLSTSASSGNDKILANDLTLSSSDTIHINALSGAANLDTTADYILFAVVNSPTMATTPTLVFDGTPPGNSANYSVRKVGNNIVLRFTAVSSPTVTASITPSTALRYQSVTINAIVTPGSGTVTNVSVNLSSIGGPASQKMTDSGDHINYSWTTNVAAGTPLGTATLPVTVTDNTPLIGTALPTLTVIASTETWNGGAVNDNWSSAANWTGPNAPGYVGDTLIFAGTIRLTPNMENSYTVNGLTFDGTAGSFTIGTANSSTLTLSGTVENDSANTQTLNVPMSLNGPVQLNANGGNFVLGQTLDTTGGSLAISGPNTTTISGGLAGSGASTIASGSTVVLSGNSSTATGTIADNGTLQLVTSPTALGAAQVVTVSSGNTVYLKADTNTTFTGGINANNIINFNADQVSSGISNTLTLNGPLTWVGNGTLNANGGSGYNLGLGDLLSSTATLNANSANLIIHSYSAFGNSSSLTFGGPFNTSVTGSITNANTKALTLIFNQTGIVTLWGPTVLNPLVGPGLPFLNSGFAVNNGTVILNHSQAASTASTVAATIGFGGNAAALLLGGTDVNGSTGGVTVGKNIIVQDVGGDPLVLGGNNTSGINTFAGNITLGGSTNVGKSVTLLATNGGEVDFTGIIATNGTDTSAGVTVGDSSHTGVVKLLGANTYKGLTTVNNGILVISTRLAGGGDFVLADGKTLGVTNAANAASALMANLTLGTSGPTTNVFDNVASATVPIINATGAVTVNGGSTIVITTNNAITSVGVYPLIKYGSVSGSFTLATTPTNFVATLTNDTSNGWIALNVTSAVSPVNLTPTNITATVTGSQLVLSWPADHTGWSLQAQTNSLTTGLGTNWVTIPNSNLSSSYTNTINPASGSVFYRMFHP